MEVLDDMKLAKIVKQSGFRSAVGIAQDFCYGAVARGHWEYRSRSDEELFCGCGIQVVHCCDTAYRNNLREYFAVFGASLCTRVGAGICGSQHGDCVGISFGDSGGDARVAVVCAYAAFGGGYFRIHVVTVDRRDTPAGRNCLAGDVLSVGGITAWGLCRPEKAPVSEGGRDKGKRAVFGD